MDQNTYDIKKVICEWINQIKDQNLLYEIYSIIKQIINS